MSELDNLRITIGQQEAEIERLEPLQYRQAPCHKFCESTAYEIEARGLKAEIERLKEDLIFVERWAVHHAGKPHMTSEQALGCIAHYPTIQAITKGYSDGKLPNTFDPYAEIEQLRVQLAQQADMVEKCMVAMNANADKGERANAALSVALEALESLLPHDGYEGGVAVWRLGGSAAVTASIEQIKAALV